MNFGLTHGGLVTYICTSHCLIDSDDWFMMMSWMKTFSVLLALCEGNPPVTGRFPSQRPVMHSFYVFFDLCLNKQLSNLRCHHAHYDITAMCSQAVIWTSADFLLIGPSRTNFSEIFIKIPLFSFKKIWKCCLLNGGHLVLTFKCNLIWSYCIDELYHYVWWPMYCLNQSQFNSLAFGRFEWNFS